MFSVTFAKNDGSYTRTVEVIGVPRVGDLVRTDHGVWRVSGVVWNVIGGGANGRSVTVYLD